MAVLIKGMEMPTEDEEIIIRISPNGTVMTEYALPITGVKAVPVPPHGDLIDVEELMEKIAGLVPYSIETGYEKAFTDGLSSAYEIVKASPTIIPADTEEEEMK